MADETLLDAIIKINVDGENVEAELENILRRVRTGLGALGNIPKATLEPINTASLGRALEQLRQIRALMSEPTSGGGGEQYRSMTRAVDELLSKEQALLAAQQRRVGVQQTSLRRASGAGDLDPGPSAAAESRADARERDRLARRARILAEATANQERLANSVDPNRDRKLETLGRHLGAQEDPRTTDRLRAFNRREAALTAERDTALKSAMGNLGPAPERASLESQLGHLTQQRSAYEQNAPYTAKNKGRLEAIEKEMDRLAEEKLVADRRQLAALERGAALAERSAAKRQQEFAKRQQAGEPANLPVVYDADFAAKQQGHERTRIGRLEQLRREALAPDARQAGASAVRTESAMDAGMYGGADAAGSSLRARSLALDAQRLRAKEAGLSEELRQVRLSGSSGAAQQRLSALSDQLVTVRSAQLRNEASVRRNQWAEQGRGGFMGGLTSGPFGSEGGEPGKFNARDMAYQAGQATKYYALYSALNMVQMALADGVRMAGEYSRAIVDISTAYTASKDVASDYANQFAEAGAKLGLDLSSSIDAALRFSTTFRKPDGTPDPEAGEQGAKLAGYFRVFSGDKDGKLDTSKQLADVSAILQAYGKPPEASEQLMDRALYIATKFGQREPSSMLSGAAMMGDLGRQSGFSATEMQATVAGLMRNLGVSGDVAGGDLKRFLGSQNSKEVTEVMDRYGIDVYQNFKSQLAELRPLLESMKPDEKTRVLTGLGDDRTGSIVNAMFKTADEAQSVAGKSETDAAGLANKRATEIMASFGEALNRFTAQATLAFVTLANSLGAIDVLNSAANVLSIVVGGIGLLGSALSALPGPLKTVLANLVALTLAARVARAAQVATAGTAFATRAGDAWAAGRLFSAEGARGATRARFGVAAGEAAEGAAAGASYTRSSVWAGATRGLRDSSTAAMTFTSAAGGMARGIGGVISGFVAAAGPMLAVAAALGVLQAVLSGMESLNIQKEAREGYKKDKEDAEKNNLGIDELEKNIDSRQARQTKLAEQGEGWSGLFSNIGKYAAQGEGMTHATSVSDEAKKMAEEIAVLRAQLEAAKRQADVMSEAEARGNLGRTKSIWGPQYTPGGINRGVDLMKARRFGPETSSAVMGDMLQNAPVETVAGAPEAVAKGIEYMQKQVNAIQDPMKRMAAQRANVDQLRAASARLATGGQAAGAVVELLQGASEQAGSAYLQTVMYVTQRRIAHIKSLSKDSPQARAQIAELMEAAMDAAVSAGTTEGFEAMLSLMDMADKAFLDKYEKGLAAQRAALENQAAHLAAAAAAASGEQTKSEGWDTESLRSQARDKDQTVASDKVAKAVKKQDDFKLARTLSAPDGGAFKWPDVAAEKGPTAGDIELARLGTLARPGDAISGARNAVRIAQYRMAHHKDQVEYWNAVKELQEAQFSLGQAMAERARQTLSASTIPGDSFSEAEVGLKVAKNVLANASKDNYWDAVKGLKDAQYRYSQEQLSAATSREMLAIDTTNPVARARAELNSAQRRRDYDKARGVSKATLASDDVDVKDRRQALARTAWEQQFGDMATNHDLNRISLSAYMSYLNSQKAYLSAVKNKTRDQVDELNQVDRALKSITEGMSAQWNLGDIKVPTPYEMRRALGVDGGYGGAGGGTVSNVSISISGADLNAVKSVLGDYLGQSRIQSAPTAVQRV